MRRRWGFYAIAIPMPPRRPVTLTLIPKTYSLWSFRCQVVKEVGSLPQTVNGSFEAVDPAPSPPGIGRLLPDESGDRVPESGRGPAAVTDERRLRGLIFFSVTSYKPQ